VLGETFLERGRGLCDGGERGVEGVDELDGG
jgi:hypothetical protein